MLAPIITFAIPIHANFVYLLCSLSTRFVTIQKPQDKLGVFIWYTRRDSGLHPFSRQACSEYTPARAFATPTHANFICLVRSHRLRSEAK